MGFVKLVVLLFVLVAVLEMVNPSNVVEASKTIAFPEV